MKISTKGRYALAAATHMAQHYSSGEYVPVLSISNRLGISKIYLEQVFSLLKISGLVTSIKGAQGGYQLSRIPEQITALDVLSAVESPLFEQVHDTVSQKAEEVETALRELVFDALDNAVTLALEKVTLSDIVVEVQRHKQNHAMMFYI